MDSIFKVIENLKYDFKNHLVLESFHLTELETWKICEQEMQTTCIASPQ